MIYGCRLGCVHLEEFNFIVFLVKVHSCAQSILGSVICFYTFVTAYAIVFIDLLYLCLETWFPPNICAPSLRPPSLSPPCVFLYIIIFISNHKESNIKRIYMVEIIKS